MGKIIETCGGWFVAEATTIANVCQNNTAQAQINFASKVKLLFEGGTVEAALIIGGLRIAKQEGIGAGEIRADGFPRD